jgi:Rrf2 family transcriptional regulator, iron-sulfur cluster assembly transcription factor
LTAGEFVIILSATSVVINIFVVLITASEQAPMQITMTTEYAIRAMLFLSSHPFDSTHRIAEIATAAEIPDSYLRKIIPVLAKAGFVRSSVGVTGGIQLAMAPTAISLLEVFEAVEGRTFLNKCLIHRGVCHRDEYCPVHVIWAEIQQQMMTRLRGSSLADLAQMNAANQANLVRLNLGVPQN